MAHFFTEIGPINERRNMPTHRLRRSPKIDRRRSARVAMLHPRSIFPRPRRGSPLAGRAPDSKTPKEIWDGRELVALKIVQSRVHALQRATSSTTSRRVGAISA